MFYKCILENPTRLDLEVPVSYAESSICEEVTMIILDIQM